MAGMCLWHKVKNEETERERERERKKERDREARRKKMQWMVQGDLRERERRE